VKYLISLLFLICNLVFASDCFIKDCITQIESEIVNSYTFNINSNYYTRDNVLKLSYYSFETLSYETSYIYESHNGLEKIYHDFNSEMSVVQRLYYEFPSKDQLIQFLNTGDMSFNSYLYVDMDVDYLYGHKEIKSLSVTDAIISLGVQGKDLIANNFNMSNTNTEIDVDFNVPFSFVAFY